MDNLIDYLKAHLTPAWGFTTRLTVGKAEGIYLYADDGRRYMDFSSGHAVTNIGYSHPNVVEAVKAQAERFLHSGGIFYYEPLRTLVERLSAVTPPGMDSFFFANSGAEAVEGAVKLARYVTGRQAIISFSGAFHGRTLGAISLGSSNALYRSKYQPLLPSVYHAPYPYCYRCPTGAHPGTCETYCLDYINYLFTNEVSPGDVAAIIIEPVLGEGGYVPAPAGFIERLRELCTEHGILLIFDEVQTGIGRTCRWFALEHYNVVPDIITVAKGIASGLPLSGIISTKEIMGAWQRGAHGTTFGGNPVACAAAVATIDAIREEDMLRKSERTAEGVMNRLWALKDECDAIGDVRGLGYMFGVEFVKKVCEPDPAAVEALQSKCLDKGLVIIECGTHKNVVRLVPPLVTTPAQMDEALSIFEEAVRGL
ncbi:MAG TPA: aspartate aminotransferase family protein [Nitrospirota bacterium]|nr:aspartate aminotransferase family protein [Nitrospirota bacterium]